MVAVSALDEVTTDRSTVPLNPLVPWSVMVEVATAPTGKLRLVGLAVIVKSCLVVPVTVNGSETVLAWFPLAPVTDTV